MMIRSSSIRLNIRPPDAGHFAPRGPGHPRQRLSRRNVQVPQECEARQPRLPGGRDGQGRSAT